MGNIVETAKCRFCGQMTQIEADEKLTAAQAEEQATMTCNCTEAVEYQKERQRKEKAMLLLHCLNFSLETVDFLLLLLDGLVILFCCLDAIIQLQGNHESNVDILHFLVCRLSDICSDAFR